MSKRSCSHRRQKASLEDPSSVEEITNYRPISHSQPYRLHLAESMYHPLTALVARAAPSALLKDRQQFRRRAGGEIGRSALQDAPLLVRNVPAYVRPNRPIGTARTSEMS